MMLIKKEFREKALEKSLLALENDLENNFDKIIKRIVQDYDLLFKSIKKSNKKVAYVNFYILRTNFKVGREYCLLKAYTKDWYLDTKPIELAHDASYVYGHFYNYSKEMLTEQKRYIAYRPFEARRYMILQWEIYIPYIVFLVKASLDEIIKLDSYNFEKDKDFKMYVGEYKDMMVEI